MNGSRWSLQARAYWGIGPAATSRLRVCECIFHDCSLTLLRDTARINVPDLGACSSRGRSVYEGGRHQHRGLTQCGHELLVVRNNDLQWWDQQ